jgi:hypothetical protein
MLRREGASTAIQAAAAEQWPRSGSFAALESLPCQPAREADHRGPAQVRNLPSPRSRSKRAQEVQQILLSEDSVTGDGCQFFATPSPNDSMKAARFVLPSVIRAMP